MKKQSLLTQSTLETNVKTSQVLPHILIHMISTPSQQPWCDIYYTYNK